MKSAKSFFFQILMMAFLFPTMLLSMTQLNRLEDDVQAQFLPQREERMILVDWGGERREMELEEYVIQVVLGEMPPEFETEALKAQAVAARTFGWKAYTTGGKHGDGSVCTNASCCQGFVTEENFVSYYGTHEDLKKVKEAVDATAGVVMTYNGQLIEAAYFSSSGGNTEDALAVWGSDYPYLTAKESPEESEQGEQTRAFSAAFLENSLNTRLEGAPDAWFHDWTYTAGGGVESVAIGNRTFSGTEIRKLLKLRSTAFSVTIENGVIFFHTKGYGHRVGMSQYGANAMAKLGGTWEEILNYYYSGARVTSISEMEGNYLPQFSGNATVFQK